MFGIWYIDYPIYLILIVMIMLVLLGASNERWARRNPWEASFVKARPGWRWQREMTVRRWSGDFPQRS